MTGVPSKKPWWVRGRGQGGRGLTLFTALFLTTSAGWGLLNALRAGNFWWGAVSVVGLIAAVWTWAVVFWEQRHHDDGKEAHHDG